MQAATEVPRSRAQAKTRADRRLAPPTQAATPTDFRKVGFFRLRQVLEVIPVSASTWWEWVKNGKAPRPLKLGANMTAWKASDIVELIDRLATPAGQG